MSSCKDEPDPQPDPVPLALKTPKSEVVVFEAAAVSIKGITLDKDTVAASVGSQIIKLVKMDTLLTFLMPDLPGSQTLRVILNDKTYQVAFQVLPKITVANPEMYVAEKIEAITLQEATLDSVVEVYAALPGGAGMAKYVAAVKESRLNFEAAFAALSAQDKAVVAAVIAANADAFAPAISPLTFIDSLNARKTDGWNDDFWDSFPGGAAPYLDQMLWGGILVAGGVMLAPAAGPLITSAVAAIGAYNVYQSGMEMYGYITSGIDKPTVNTLFQLDDWANKTDTTFVLEADTRYKVTVSGDYRSLGAVDANSSSTYIIELNGYIQDANKILDEINPYLPSQVPNMPDLSSVSTTRSQTHAVNPQYLSVRNPSASNVTITKGVEGDKLTLKFDILDLYDDQELVAFDLVYDYPGLVSNTLRVEVLATRISPPVMVFIPGGTFQMGDASSSQSDEKPVHQVTVSDFYLGETEVTQAQWVAVMGSNPSYFNNCGQCPVEVVSWDDIQVFLQKLNAKTGKTYRLPTEAEWEYAAGGGAANRTKWAGTSSETSLEAYVWYDANSDGKTHPVKTKQPNALGVYDMSGNVWEWCEDDWHENYQGAPGNGSAWIDNPRGANRVFRGGSWLAGPVDCRVASRYFFGPGYRLPYLGFRLAL